GLTRVAGGRSPRAASMPRHLGNPPKGGGAMCECGATHSPELLKAQISRRAALVGALATGVGAVLAGAAGPGATPALAQPDPLVDGVIDLHVHADPDVDARSIDDAGAAAAYAQVGARGALAKHPYP